MEKLKLSECEWPEVNISIPNTNIQLELNEYMKPLNQNKMNTEITLDRADYVYLETRSSYNNNYYQHKETGEVIVEQYEECSNTYDYFLFVEDKSLTFLGASVKRIDDGIITIHTDWIS